MESHASTIAAAGNRTLAQAFDEGGRTAPDLRLIVHSESRPADISLTDILARGRIVGEQMRRLGIGPGDVVALQLPAWAEWMEACVGIAHAGAVLLPVVSIYGPRELGFILRQSGARMLVTPDRFRKADYSRVLEECGDLPAFRHHVVIGPDVPDGALPWAAMTAPVAADTPATRGPDDLAMLVYTSGTTADPKGVRHSHRSLLAEIASMAVIRQHLRSEAVLSPWPPGHVAGVISMMRFLVGHTRLVLMDSWNAGDAAMLIERHRITSCGLTPFHLHGLVDAADRDGRDLSSIDNCLVGAAPVPPALIARCDELGLRPYRSYGSSEHPSVSAGLSSDPLEKRLNTDGRPMPGSEIRFVDDDGNDVERGSEGELAVRGPELFLGYHDARLNDAAFLPGGWFKTGDIGRLDQDGYIVITDRKKDVIIRGGENISSREVEDLLFGHPDIADAAVVAAPDERMGEVVRAYVIQHAGAAITLAAITQWFMAAGIAKQKIPEQLVLVEELPRNSTGKVLKHELRAAAKREAQGAALA